MKQSLEGRSDKPVSVSETQFWPICFSYSTLGGFEFEHQI